MDERMSRREMFGIGAAGVGLAVGAAFGGWKVLEIYEKGEKMKGEMNETLDKMKNFTEVKRSIGLSRALHFSLLDSGVSFGVVEKDGVKGLQIFDNDKKPSLLVVAGKHEIRGMNVEENNGNIVKLSIKVLDKDTGVETVHQIK